MNFRFFLTKTEHAKPKPDRQCPRFIGINFSAFCFLFLQKQEVTKMQKKNDKPKTILNFV